MFIKHFMKLISIQLCECCAKNYGKTMCKFRLLSNGKTILVDEALVEALTRGTLATRIPDGQVCLQYAMVIFFLLIQLHIYCNIRSK